MDPRMVPVGRLFARLLLHEMDASMLAELRTPEIVRALEDVGVRVPCDATVDELAVDYCERILRPAAVAPPVQSLWQGGEYEGDCARAVRELARYCAFEFSAAAARGAPVDHVGSILLLWCEAVEDGRFDVATRIAMHHLAWVEPALRVASEGGGFYGDVCAAVIAWCRQVSAPSTVSPVDR
ncbi:MAG: hypothetical protein KDB80_09970 [Planctomycetes bacterium]|nr:hypothetical protein [Planctomycetota bacterium]